MRLWDANNGEAIGWDSGGQEIDTYHESCWAEAGDVEDHLVMDFTSQKDIKHILRAEYACLHCEAMFRGTHTPPAPVNDYHPFL